MKKEHKERPLLATKRDISMTTEDLMKRVERWRILQSVHMPSIIEVSGMKTGAAGVKKSVVMGEAEADGEEGGEEEGKRNDADAMEIENEYLYLPSDFGEPDRHQLQLTDLAQEEAMLREGHAYECILQLRQIAKLISIFHYLRQKNNRGQRQNTRSQVKREALELTRDRLLETYNTTRKALSSLCNDNNRISERFPPLTVDDLYRKPTVDKRQLGDTYRPDGRLWSLGKPSHSVIAAPSSQSTIDLPSESPQARQSGRLWSPIIGLTDAEMEAWELEGQSECLCFGINTS